MRGARGLALWSALVAVAAAVLLMARKAGEHDVKAAGLAALASVLAVVGTRALLRRLVCLLLCVLALIPIANGRPVLVVGGALLVLLGLAGVLLSPTWPALGGKYEARGGRQPAEPDLWTRIERGDDPTA